MRKRCDWFTVFCPREVAAGRGLSQTRPYSDRVPDECVVRMAYLEYFNAFNALGTLLSSRPLFMALIKPFAALRPKPELAPKICELPYDVMSSDEARQIANGNPLSFLHVSKPEIDLSRDVDVYSPQVYAKGKENFERFISQSFLRQD